jgi:hypothetical protein
MNTFLKVLLAAVLLIVAIKISPILFVVALAGLIAAVVLGAVGLSLLAALVAVVIAFAIALSPIWIPVLCVIGLVKLFSREDKAPVPAAPTSNNVPPPITT